MIETEITNENQCILNPRLKYVFFSFRLSGLTLKGGGRLIFDPTATSVPTLVSGYVLVGNGGSLVMGSTIGQCRYEGWAEIVLTGEIEGVLSCSLAFSFLSVWVFLISF